VVGGKRATSGSRPVDGSYFVTPGYFRAAQISLVQARLFTETDDGKAPSVAIIDQRLAEQFLPGQNPLGQRVNIWGADREIVGVVANVKEHGFNENMPEIYFPQAQVPRNSLSFVIRGATDPMALASSVTGAIQSFDSDQPVRDVRTLQDIYDEGLLSTRLSTTLLVVFALLALVLAGVGTYGVVSYSASQRTHEIGIRM